MIEISSHTVAQLLYLVHSDPEELQEALGELRAPDIAEALKELPPEAAAKVMAALPFDLAVQVFDEPELTRHRCDIIQNIDPERVGLLIEAMSAPTARVPTPTMPFACASRRNASLTSAVGCNVWSERSPRKQRPAIRRKSGNSS